MRYRQPLRTFHFNPARETKNVHYRVRARAAYPLLHSGSTLGKWNRSEQHYHGRKGFDNEDHPIPVLGVRSSEFSHQHVFHDWDRYLNPQLIQCSHDLPPPPEYMGKNTGKLSDSAGWMRVSGSWKFTDTLGKWARESDKGMNHVERMAPKWMTVPRIAATHPDSRYEGKLQYTELPLSKILWAVDCGELNPNEVITLNLLREAQVITDHDVIWPGLKLVHDGCGALRYPINVELQNATPEAIAAVENAGGTFTATYLSTEGLYQEMHPEEFPTWMEQQLPERDSFEQVYSDPRNRGYLVDWHEEEGKFAHSGAGRRLSHYVAPPKARDFPETFEEYERVKHHQKWHLNQPGTGTILPFVSMEAKEWEREPAKLL